MVIYASPEAVGIAWAHAFAGAVAGRQLPSDNTTWAASGFVLATPAGGWSNKDYQFHHPVISIQTWACNPTSDMPPWGKARNLVETLRAETYNDVARLLVLPYCDQNARVLQSTLVTEPRPVYGDLGLNAAYVANFQLHWVAEPKS